MAAHIDGERCSGCGICVEACPREAIRIEGGLATVDAERCTGCAVCVDECPNEAICVP